MVEESHTRAGGGGATVARVLVRKDGRVMEEEERPRGLSRAGRRDEHDRSILSPGARGIAQPMSDGALYGVSVEKSQGKATYQSSISYAG